MNAQEAHLIITADGDLFDLRQPGLLSLLAWQGYGLPGIEMQTQRGYKQHGQTTLGWQLEPRTLSLILLAQGVDQLTYLLARQRLYTFLRPNRGSGILTLRHVRKDGTRRDICCRWTGGGRFEDDEADSAFPTSGQTTIELTADDPSWYDPTARMKGLSAAVAEGLIFPASFGAAAGEGTWVFKASSEMGGFSVAYAGDWYSYPRLVLTGPYSWLRIECLETGVYLLFGVPLGDGEQLVIDLTPGQQSIQDGDGVDHFGDLTDGNLVDFYLSPGTNTYIVSAADRADGTTTATLHYYERFIGE